MKKKKKKRSSLYPGDDGFTGRSVRKSVGLGCRWLLGTEKTGVGVVAVRHKKKKKKKLAVNVGKLNLGWTWQMNCHSR